MTGTDLTSAEVVVSAPMSFAGSAQRIWHITRDHAGWAYAGMVTLAILAIILAWYLIFGLLLVPYRLVRRGQRKQKLAQIRHQELMNRVWAAGETEKR
jgi:heme/copper-type cytochrome/quinol oxidase subunit 2